MTKQLKKIPQIRYAMNPNFSHICLRYIARISCPDHIGQDVVFIMLINVKTPTIVGVFNIYEQDKFRAQLS